MSAAARFLFLEPDGGGGGRKVSLMAGCGIMSNFSGVCFVAIPKMNCRIDIDDASSSVSGRIILRCLSSCTVFERWS
jgi:hypothetical protein